MAHKFKVLIIFSLLLGAVYWLTLPEGKAHAYIDGCHVTFQTYNGNFIQADGGGGGTVNANPGASGAWETFEIVNISGGRVALKTYNGHYLYANGGGGAGSLLKADSTAIAGWEAITLVDAGGGKQALRVTNGINYFVGADGGGGGAVKVDASAVGGWESFIVTEGAGCTPPATPPVINNITISSGVIVADNTTQYNIVMTVTDALGAGNVSHEYALINYLGANGGAYKGYLTWYWGDAWPGYQDHRTCSGAGSYAVVQPGYGNQYIHLDACNVADSGNTRTLTFTVRFDPSFTSPVLNNDIAGYACNGGTLCAGWLNFETNFNLFQAPPTCSSVDSGGVTAAYSDTSVRFYARGVTGAGEVWFPTRTNLGGGYTWVQGNSAGGGVWYYDIPLSSFQTGAVVSDIYMYPNTIGDGGAVYCGSPSVTSYAPVTISLTADNPSVAYNGSTVIRWTTTNTTSCSLGPVPPVPGGTGGVNSTYNTGALTASITYSLSCLGVAGGNPGAVVTVTVGAAAPSCTGGSPAATWTTATSGTMVVTATGVANATSVLFPTWSDPLGQDDIVWYSGTQSGTTWTATVQLSTHTGLGVINVHIYAVNASYPPGATNPACATGSFTRLDTGTIQVDSDTSTTWTIACPLASPPCPDIPAGAPATSGTYPSRPYSTWTIIPAPKSGYDWQVTGCAVNTACTKVFP